MFKKRKFKKIVAVMITLSVLFSEIPVFAANSSATGASTANTVTATTAAPANMPTGTPPQGNNTNMMDDMKSNLTKLVSAGTITQEQMDKVLTYLESAFGKEAVNGKHEDPIAQAVSDGVITKEQGAAIASGMKMPGGDKGGNGPGETNGTNTSTAGSSTGTADNASKATATTVSTGTGKYTLAKGKTAKTKQKLTATKTDQSAVKVTNTGSLALTNTTIKTTGNSSSVENSSFYGLNAAVLAESGGKITLKKVNISTTGTGANAVFVAGTGSKVDLTDVDIVCTNTGAHGVDATLGGTLTLKNVNITTSGDGASAAIATDRGSGVIHVTGGKVITRGTKSPGIYSTGIITATGTAFTTTASEAVVIEGKNSAVVNNCDMTAYKKWGVFIYQSFSGDAEVGTGNFTMNGGTLLVKEGPAFYATNTQAVINLKNAKISAESGILLKAGADEWGTAGSNGAVVKLVTDTQTLIGDMAFDAISSGELVLRNNTLLTGGINSDGLAKSVGLSLDATSTWSVTKTSYITAFVDEDTTLSNIEDNGNTIYYDGKADANQWLGGKTITLKEGGTLTPINNEQE